MARDSKGKGRRKSKGERRGVGRIRPIQKYWLGALYDTIVALHRQHDGDDHDTACCLANVSDI